MRIILMDVLAVVLVIYAISLVFTSNFNMGNLLIWVLAAMACIYALWHGPIDAWLGTKAGRAVGAVLLVGFVFLIGMLVFVATSGYVNKATGKETIVVVLGAGLRKDRPSLLLRYRLDAAYTYAMEHPDAVVITTGGQGNGETVPEGQAMRDYLIAKGLPANRVLQETKSTSTEENFQFAKAILEDAGYDTTQDIAYVSNAFHCYRAGCYAVQAGFAGAKAIPAGIPLRSVPTCYLREVFAVLYYWVFKTSESGLMHSMVGILSLNKKLFYK